jgi:hypothetical protein
MTTELGGELLERIRLRAYYLSLDRPGSSDKLNWLEAEAFERAALLSPAPEPIAEEPEPPAEPIAEPEPVVASVAPEPLAAEPEPAAPINPLRYLEAPLGRLSKRFKPAELAPRVVDLTSNEEPLLAEALWDSAAAELLALDHLNNKGLLQSLGGLAGPRSPSAFQACLGQKKVNVGVELKPAIGSGFSKLRLRIAEGVSALGQRLGQELESVTWYRGRAAAATSGANDGVTAFLSSLETLTSRPTGALPLQVGALQFDVVIAERAAEGPASLVSQALPAFKKQLEARSKEAERAADAPAAFLLANVILPAASDETDEPATRLLEAAARRASAGAAHLANSAGSLWLGLLQLDLREPTPRTTLLVRPAANWPMPSRELATLLEASIAVL